MTILLEAREVSKHFGRLAVVDQVSLRVERERIVTLIGPNGSGKTTLLKLLLGLELPDTGEVVRKPDLHIGYVPQRLPVDPVLPVNVHYFLGLHKRHRPTAAAVEEVVNLFSLGNIVEQSLAQLSGGELQRVLLARALLCEPELLVLDEPGQGIDVDGQAKLYALLTRISRERKLAVLMVSHDLHFVMSATDTVICLHHHVCCAGHPQTVRDDPHFAALVGADVARSLAVYTHHHHHKHES